MFTRRTVLQMAAAALPSAAFAAKINSTVNGVMIGNQTYSWRDRSVDDAIAGMKEVGLGYCELWSGHIEPKGMSREDLVAWRKTAPLDEFKKVAKKFKDAGIEIYAFNYSFRDSMSDEEITRGFEIAKAMGVNRITASANVTTAQRISPVAEKHKVWVGMHNHSNLKENEFARPEDFEKAMTGTSKYIVVNLDIGHFVAAGFDPIDYIQKNHKKIITLHIKDRKKNQGPNTPFGEGDTPIKEVLQLLRTNRYRIPAMIEYEYKGADTLAEMKKCYDYCKNALTTS